MRLKLHYNEAHSGIHRFVPEVVVAYRKSYISIRRCALVLMLVASIASATTTTKTKTKHAQVTKTHILISHHSGKSKTTKSASRSHGQRGIDEQRTLEIQNALIKEHYLTGEPSGTWDQPPATP